MTTDTRLTVERLHEMRAKHLEEALRSIMLRHEGADGDAVTLAIARKALGQ